MALKVVWTDYMRYRAKLRGFDLERLEQILNRSTERYYDTETGRSDEPEANSIELGPNITAELNEKGELIGVEILNATAFLRDSIMESIQFKLLQTSTSQAA